MTVSEYRKKYGALFQQAARQMWFQALLQTLKDEHPVRRLHEKKDGDRLAGAVLFLSEIKGYEDALNTIEEMLAPAESEPFDPPSRYTESEIAIEEPK